MQKQRIIGLSIMLATSLFLAKDKITSCFPECLYPRRTYQEEAEDYNLIALAGATPAPSDIKGSDYLDYLASITSQMKQNKLGSARFTTSDLDVALYSTTACGYCVVWKELPFESIESDYPGSNFYIIEERGKMRFHAHPIITAALDGTEIFQFIGYPAREAMARGVTVPDILRACIDGTLKY